MKTIPIVLLILSSFIIGCANSVKKEGSENDDRIEIVRKYFQYRNENNISQIKMLLDTAITIKTNGELITLDNFCNQLEQMYSLGFVDTISSIYRNDSLIKVSVNSSNKFIKYLKTSPIQLDMNFIVYNKKIQRISSDTANGTKKVIKELDDKTERFGEWFMVRYPSEFKSMTDFFSMPEKYLKEYSLLSEKEIEHFLISNLTGEYICKKGLYNKLVFKGKSTVVVYGMGIPYPTSYIVDEKYIRIKTDKSDLLLRIKDSKTLIGEGFAKGTFKKK